MMIGCFLAYNSYGKITQAFSRDFDDFDQKIAFENSLDISSGLSWRRTTEQEYAIYAPSVLTDDYYIVIADGGYQSVVARDYPYSSDFYEFDWPTHTWVIPTSRLNSDVAKRKADIEAKLSSILYAPITYDSIQFDSSAESQNRLLTVIFRLMRGAGLPTGWTGWRAYDNSMHWASETSSEVLGHLNAISTIIEDTAQGALSNSWALKDSIDAIVADTGHDTAWKLTQLWAIDINAGWPA